MAINVETLSFISALFYATALFLSVFALWRSRTPQGATAWIIGLVGFPFLAVPLFLIFGRNKFYGYVKARKEIDKSALRELSESEALHPFQVPPPRELEALTALCRQARQPGFLRGNQVELLIDGQKTFISMLESIKKAEKYILFQFYIFKEDEVGLLFKETLLRKAAEGVKIYFLYDRIGTSLSSRFLREMRSAGIEIHGFRCTKSKFGPYQINFRNHRKIIVVDGEESFVGGINVGEEYRRQSPNHWRDTHLKVSGPAALASQLSFLKDWYWERGSVPDLTWEPRSSAQAVDVLLLHTGPADEGEVCLQAHLSLIQSARRRIWLANPYFVPSEGLSNALAQAALRGVEVKIIVPSENDNVFVSYASLVHIEKLLKAGVQFWKYTPGFLHQKTILIDERVGSVGSANLDSRSLFINFEMMGLVSGEAFAKELEIMLSRDFEVSEKIELSSLENLPLLRKLLCRASNLLAPML